MKEALLAGGRARPSMDNCRSGGVDDSYSNLLGPPDGAERPELLQGRPQGSASLTWLAVRGSYLDKCGETNERPLTATRGCSPNHRVMEFNPHGIKAVLPVQNHSTSLGGEGHTDHSDSPLPSNSDTSKGPQAVTEGKHFYGGTVPPNMETVPKEHREHH